jgi:hypothetical protein
VCIAPRESFHSTPFTVPASLVSSFVTVAFATSRARCGSASSSLSKCSISCIVIAAPGKRSVPRWVRRAECAPICPTIERSMPNFSISHSMAGALPYVSVLTRCSRSPVPAERAVSL